MSTKQIEALKLALEGLEKWHFDKDPRGADQYITAIREALAERCVCGEPDTPGTHRTDGPCLAEQSAEIPQSITCPFCESQHVPGWLHDYNMDRMKKTAPVAEPHKQQEPVAVYVGDTWCGSVVRLYEDLPLETPLYTSPQPRKPLTDEQIEQCMKQAYSTVRGRNLELAFARAIEAAHGITGETQ